jgi:hypothetical protein
MKITQFKKWKADPSKGEVFTPISLVSEMLDKIPDEVWKNPNSKFLDPCMGKGTFLIEIVRRLTYIYGYTETNAKSRVYGYDIRVKYINHLQRRGFLNVRHKDFLNEEINMKFDAIVGNPPYLQGVHYKFFNKGFSLLKEKGILYFIHPSTIFLNKKNTKKNSHEKRTIEIVSNHKSELTFVDGNKIFDAGLFVPLSLSKIFNSLDKKIKVIFKYHESETPLIKITQSLDDVYIHADDRVISIKNKVIDKLESSIEDNLYRNGKTNNLYLNINKMSGNTPKEGRVNPDFYCMIYKKYENNIQELLTQTPKERWEQRGGSQFNQIAVSSNQEGMNVANYLMTKFARFCLSIYKISSYIDCGELKMVPWMNPNIVWTDEMLYEYFEISEDEISFIENYIGDWYDRDFN